MESTMFRTIASIIADLDEKSPEREIELMHGDASAKSEPSSFDRSRPANSRCAAH